MMNLVKYFFNQNSLKEYKENMKDFGLKTTLKKIVFKNIMLLSRYRLNLYQKFIYKFCVNFSKDIIEECNVEKNNGNIEDDINIIWTMWLQGIEKAPKLVKSCVYSQKKYAKLKKYKYIILNEDNISRYLEIPDYIIKKLKDNKISYTQFSDIVRVGVLRKYGGIWLDSTIFVTTDFDEEFYKLDFYTNKKSSYKDMNKRNISKGRWTGFFVKTKKENILFEFAWRFFISYWKEYNSLIDFYLIDYVFCIAYEKFETVRKQIDDVPDNNQKIYELNRNLNNECDMQELKSILKMSHIFKLSYKQELKENNNGKKTVYGLLTKNLNDKNE